MLIFFIIYVLLANFVILNMLTGIMYDVVNACAQNEKLKNDEAFLRDTIEMVLKEMDKDANNKISRDEFIKMKKNRKVMKALSTLGIDDMLFNKFSDFFFTPLNGHEDVQIDMEYMENCFLRLRPGTPVCSLDVAFVNQYLTKSHNEIEDKMDLIDKFLDEPCDEPEVTVDTRSKEKKDNEGTITTKSLEFLERTASAEIIKELQRRLGMADLEKTGVPLSMMDEDLQNHVKAHQPFSTLGVPQPEESNKDWGQETLSC